MLAGKIELREKQQLVLLAELPPLRAKLASLDATLVMFNEAVRPDAAGIVHAWAGKYGKRGALGAFLLETIRDAAPATVTTTLLTNLAIRHFGLTTEVMPTERAKFRRTVTSRLHEFFVKGLIVPLHDRSSSQTGIWRCKGLPTHAEVSALAARESGHEPRDILSVHPHPT